MPEGHFAALREYADDTARQPDFETIRRRAGRVRRRRRRATSSVVAGVVAIVAVAFGLSMGPGTDGQPTTGPTDWPTDWPTVGPTLEEKPAGWPRWTTATAVSRNELYGVLRECEACDLQLHVSADGGRTWDRRTIPPPARNPHPLDNPFVWLTPVAPGVLVWHDSVATPREESMPEPSLMPNWKIDFTGQWITIDGGRTWRQPTFDEKPVQTVPPNTRLLDCTLVQQESPCRFYAVDPTTGRYAPLANQPTGLLYRGYPRVDVPIGGNLWIPGLDPATRKPAVASSTDRGRTWTTHVFTDGNPSTDNHRSPVSVDVPVVAADKGRTAYALVAGTDEKTHPYRTTDGGRTWKPLPGPAGMGPGFVTADGAHVVGYDGGFRASRRGGPYEPVTVTGYPVPYRRTVLNNFPPEATGCRIFVGPGFLLVSDNGLRWRTVDLP